MHNQANNHKLPHMQRNWIAINLSLQLKTSLEIYCRIRYSLSVICAIVCKLEEKSAINTCMRADAPAYDTHTHTQICSTSRHSVSTRHSALVSFEACESWNTNDQGLSLCMCMCVYVCGVKVTMNWIYLWLFDVGFACRLVVALVNISCRIVALWHCQSPRWVPNSICARLHMPVCVCKFMGE